ncbi:hypothetical protein, partial [Actinoallomurus acaciae]
MLSAVAGIVAATVMFGSIAARSDTGEDGARSNATWLSHRLASDGTLQNPNGGALPDHGLMIDTLFAMHAAGEGELADPIVRYFDDDKHATDYYTWDGLAPGMGYDKVIVAGATAKVLVAAEVAGRNPRDFGGHDMVAETEGTIMTSGPDKGRASDYSKDPALADLVYNNSNMFGQALAVIGLAGVGRNNQPALDRLLTQQCSEGYFRIFFGYIPTTETGDEVTPDGQKLSTCDEGKAYDQSAPDGDATAMSLSALLAARRAGATGLDGPIGKAVNWLKSVQDPGGGWGGGVSTEAPNTNSTGLIVQALTDAGGADDAVRRGVAYLSSAQVTAGADGGDPLSDQIGAIAYTPEDYQSAKSTGITGMDTWVRAGAQAALGLARIGFYDLTQGKSLPAPGGGSTTSPTPTPNPTRTSRPKPKPRGSGNQAAPEPRPKPRPRGSTTSPRPTSSATPTPTTTPQAQTTGPSPAERLGAYLAGRLVNGDHVEVTEGGQTYVDYDATVDLILALHALGRQPAAAAKASLFMLEPQSIREYAYDAAYEKSAAYAEPLAKLEIIARFLQTSPSAPGDIATIAGRLREGLLALKTPAGHFVDRGAHVDSDNLVTKQAWVVLALTASGVPGDTMPLNVLLNSQCSDGSFPLNLAAAGCATGDLASTAAAVQALSGRSLTGAAGWTDRRVTALRKAAALLTARTPGDGLLRTSGAVDLPLSARVA